MYLCNKYNNIMNILTKVEDGRIEKIITVLEETYKCPIHQISTINKLDALCEVLGFTYGELDLLIAKHSPVLRTVKGHCFEVAFERVLANNGYTTKDVGGDTDIDLEVNGFTLNPKYEWDK